MPRTGPIYSGEAVIEYALLVALIAVLVLTGAVTFGGVLQNWFGALLGRITGVG